MRNRVSGIAARARKSAVGTGVLLVLLWAGSAQAVVLHHDDSNPVVLADKPFDDVIMRLSDSTAVAIAPNYILATAHQGIGNFIVIGGVNYKWTEVHAHPTADLRVIKIAKADGTTPADLTHYVPLFKPTTAVPSEVGQDVVIGGFGKGRSTTVLSDEEGPYGYTWGTTLDVQRWGTNHVDFSQDNYPVSGKTSDVLVDDFDPEGQWGATVAEAALALYDSGGGWFIKVDGEWTVAGLNAYVPGGAAHSAQSWFRNPSQSESTEFPSGDTNRAIRVSSYSSFIYSTFVGLFLPGDMDGDGDVDNFDIQPFEQALTNPNGYLVSHPTLTNFEQRGDIDGDGDFDNFDIQPFEAMLAPSTSITLENVAVPEPSSLALAVVATVGLAGRFLTQRRRA